MAAVVRACVEAPLDEAEGTVHARAADLAGSLAGRRQAATNARRRFKRA